jgi:hypothetical protein
MRKILIAKTAVVALSSAYVGAMLTVANAKPAARADGVQVAGTVEQAFAPAGSVDRTHGVSRVRIGTRGLPH